MTDQLVSQEALHHAVAFLCRSQMTDGSWSDFVVAPFTEGREWPTAFIAWCLGRLDGATQAVACAREYLLRYRTRSGGWAFGGRSAVDADSTAYALLCLASTPGQVQLSSARTVLLEHRHPDGGFTTYHPKYLKAMPPGSGYYAPTPCVTAAAGLALARLGDPADRTVVEEAVSFLERELRAGCWHSFWWERGIYSTFIAAKFVSHVARGGTSLALAAERLLAIQDEVGSWSGEHFKGGIPFLTAIAIEALFLAGESPSSVAIRRGLDWLLAAQQADGSWDSLPIMKVPPPERPWQPEVPYEGQIVPGNRCNFVTAAVASCLGRYLDMVYGDRQATRPAGCWAGSCERASIEDEVQAIVTRFAAYVDAMPPVLRELARGCRLWNDRGTGLSHSLPFWLDLELTGGRLLGQSREMALANRFGQLFCLVQDGIIDDHAGTRPEVMLALTPLYFELLLGYQRIFPANHEFWRYFDSYWQEYLTALAWEEAHHHDRLAPYTQQDLDWLGRKFSPIKICCAGIALLAGEPEEIPHLSAMIEHLQTGYQLLDDLQDWREDLANSHYTFPLMLALGGDGRDQSDDSPPIEEIQRRMVRPGVSGVVLTQVVAAFDRALSEVGHLQLFGLKAWIARLREDAAERLAILEGPGSADPARAESVIEHWGFRFGSTNIVLDVRNNRLLELDDVAGALLESSSRVGHGPVLTECITDAEAEALAELRALKLIAPTTGPVCPPILPDPPPVQALCLDLVHRCNLACTYCYAGQGRYGTPGAAMTYDTAVRAVELLLSQAPKGGKANLHFFGGEPLLCWGLLEQIIPYSQRRAEEEGKQLALLLTTNGTLMSDRIIAFLREHHVVVNLSLDGPPEIHDRARVYANGRGSYQQVLPAMQSLLAAHGRCSVRATIDPDRPQLLDVVDHLLGIGATFVHTEVASRGDEGSGLSPAVIAGLKAEYGQLKEYFIDAIRREHRILPVYALTRFLRPLAGDAPPAYYGCGMGRSYAAVSPDGQIFACHRLIDHSEYRLGDLEHGISTDARRRFTALHVDHRPACCKCWARYLCGGGCYYESIVTQGDVEHPDPAHCELIQALIAAAIEAAMYLTQIPSAEWRKVAEHGEETIANL